MKVKAGRRWSVSLTGKYLAVWQGTGQANYTPFRVPQVCKEGGTTHRSVSFLHI